MLHIQGELSHRQIDPNHQFDSFVMVSGDHCIIQNLGPAAEKNFQSAITRHAGETPHKFHKWHETFAIHAKTIQQVSGAMPLFLKRNCSPKRIDSW